MSKALVRKVKNVTRGYSDLQIKVRQATCNDPWGPSGSLMAEISEYSHNQRDFVDIMEIIDKRLNDSGKNWRHVFKSLTLLEYLIKNGAETVVAHARNNLHVIKTLKEFQYIDDEGRDQGANVRQKSKDITALLNDDDALREARLNTGNIRNRMGYPGSIAADNFASASEDAELSRALEESRRQAEIDERRRRQLTQEEIDLQKAIELSEKEAITRRMDARNRMEPQLTGDSTYSKTGPSNPGNNAPSAPGGFNPFFATSAASQPSSVATGMGMGMGMGAGLGQQQQQQQQPKPLFDLDPSSLSSVPASAAVSKNPFSATNNSSRYQWEQPKPKPTLAEMQATSAFASGGMPFSGTPGDASQNFGGVMSSGFGGNLGGSTA
eukprot:jgi/Hompol1/4330/HPOL_003620-RA